MRKSARVEASWDAGLSWSGESALRKRLREDPDLLEELFRRAQNVIDDKARSLGHRI